MDAARLLEEGTDESFAFYRDAYLGQANVELHEVTAPYGCGESWVVTEGDKYLGRIFAERKGPSNARISLDGRSYVQQTFYVGEQPDGTTSYGYTTREGAIEFLQLRLRR